MKIKKNQKLDIKFNKPQPGFPKHIATVIVTKFINENMFMVETVAGQMNGHSIILDKRDHGKVFTLAVK